MIPVIQYTVAVFLLLLLVATRTKAFEMLGLPGGLPRYSKMTSEGLDKQIHIVLGRWKSNSEALGNATGCYNVIYFNHDPAWNWLKLLWYRFVIFINNY